ncbi:hypothetical protein PoB_005950700 [Plakobranchus ocellatus]|uniref:Uncharacterized protein n=1 Tax=Plakobranchus ocellatus TaxID=259542 RepID=A0AAV4CMS8_9GAST|nr:hypothetical protein PoB_005950700 [Plakobranchus ocellatus]
MEKPLSASANFIEQMSGFEGPARLGLSSDTDAQKRLGFSDESFEQQAGQGLLSSAALLGWRTLTTLFCPFSIIIVSCEVCLKNFDDGPKQYCTMYSVIAVYHPTQHPLANSH